MSTAPSTFVLATDGGSWEPYRPSGQHVIGSVRYLRRAGDGGRSVLESGFWRGTSDDIPDHFEVVFEHDQTIYALGGHLLIETTSGEKLELTAGGSASFNKGTTVYWTILSESFEEFFVYS